MREFEFEYNSQREHLIIPEYGRHIQRMIYYAKTIVDKDARQAHVERIIELILQLFPQSKNLDDYKEKIWKHVFRIANYELDVTPPAGIEIDSSPEKRPERIPYPVSESRMRHYGNHVQRLIQKAIAMEEGPMKDEFVKIIGSYMKLAYRTWNKEHFVSDEVIKIDLGTISGGKLSLDESTSIDHLTNGVPQQQRRPQQYHKGGQQGRHSNSNYRNKGNNYNKNKRR